MDILCESQVVTENAAGNLPLNVTNHMPSQHTGTGCDPTIASNSQKRIKNNQNEFR